MGFKPCGTRVLIKPEPVSTMSGKIHLPDYTLEKPWTGTVVEHGKFKEGTDVPPIGSRVYYRQGHGKEVVINDVKHEILAIEDVLGILT